MDSKKKYFNKSNFDEIDKNFSHGFVNGQKREKKARERSICLSEVIVIDGVCNIDISYVLDEVYVLDGANFASAHWQNYKC